MRLMNYSVRTTDFCNLDCEYCYAKTDDPHGMTDETLRQVLASIALFHGASAEPITINWTGGEPMLQGAKFFELIVHMQSLAPHIKFINVMQTNLTLLDDDFIQFFEDNDFQVRTSLDLPPQNHADRRAVDNFIDTMDKIRKLQQAGVAINVNTVITSQNVDKAKEIYAFLVENGITSFSISRFVLQGNAVDHAGLLLTEKRAFGRFLIELFDLWMNDEDTTLDRITPLENLLKACESHLKKEISSTFCFHCQDQIFAINPEGKVFPSCNKFLAHEDTCFGNVHDSTLLDIVYSEKRDDFVEKVTEAKGKVCTTCKFSDICKGGCFFLAYQSNEDNPDREDFCKGYYFVFEHILRYIDDLNTLRLIHEKWH